MRATDDCCTEAHDPITERLLEYLKKTTRLDEKLPLIYWLSNQALEEFLQISPATRKRDAAILKGLRVISESFFHRRGYTREAIEAFWEFRQLQEHFDRDEAVMSIRKTLELIYASKR